MGQLNDILKEKPPENFTKSALFLHENDPSHRPLESQKLLAYMRLQHLDRPPYSTDLAPTDYHLFSGPIKKLKGGHFPS